jgi:hypothetical protein
VHIRDIPREQVADIAEGRAHSRAVDYRRAAGVDAPGGGRPLPQLRRLSSLLGDSPSGLAPLEYLWEDDHREGSEGLANRTKDGRGNAFDGVKSTENCDMSSECLSKLVCEDLTEKAIIAVSASSDFSERRSTGASPWFPS